MTEEGKRDLILWVGILAGPLIWFGSFCVNFVLAPWSCALAWKPWLYTISLAALGITALAGFMAWNQWQHLGREFPGEAGGAIARSRALASGGVLLSSMFFLIGAAQLLVSLLLGSCE